MWELLYKLCVDELFYSIFFTDLQGIAGDDKLVLLKKSQGHYAFDWSASGWLFVSFPTKKPMQELRENMHF